MGFARLVMGFARLVMGYARLVMGYARLVQSAAGGRCVLFGATVYAQCGGAPLLLLSRNDHLECIPIAACGIANVATE